MGSNDVLIKCAQQCQRNHPRAVAPLDRKKPQKQVILKIDNLKRNKLVQVIVEVICH